MDHAVAIGTDVIIIDPQYAPKVIAEPDAHYLVDIMRSIGELEEVAVFPRFAVMRHWHEKLSLPFDAFINRDEVHLNDWGYACFSHALAEMTSNTIFHSQSFPQRPVYSLMPFSSNR